MSPRDGVKENGNRLIVTDFFVTGLEWKEKWKWLEEEEMEEGIFLLLRHLAWRRKVFWEFFGATPSFRTSASSSSLFFPPVARLGGKASLRYREDGGKGITPISSACRKPT